MSEIGEALGGGERYQQGVAAVCSRGECYMATVGGGREDDRREVRGTFGRKAGGTDGGKPS